MDIRTKAVNSTGRLHLRDANDELLYTPEGAEVAVNLFSPGSKQYAKAQARQQNSLMDKIKRKGKMDQSDEQKRAENAEFLTDITESFEHLEYDELTGRALATAVYSDVTIGFIADQVTAFVSDWSNFTKVSTTN